MPADRAGESHEFLHAAAIDQLFAGNQAMEGRPALQHEGMGEAVLLVKTADQVAEPRNRRVEITVR